MGQHKTIKKLTTKAAERAKTKPLLPAGSMKLVSANLKIMKGKITKAVVNKEQQRAEFTIQTDVHHNPELQKLGEQQAEYMLTGKNQPRHQYKADAGAPGFNSFNMENR